MSNPDFLDALGDEMGRVYEACHDRLLINLARHFMFLKPGEQPGGAFVYQAKKLLEMGQLTRESVEIIKAMLEKGELDDSDEAALNFLRGEDFIRVRQVVIKEQIIGGKTIMSMEQAERNSMA